jgi:predicted phage terminase large subunit-like protein
VLPGAGGDLVLLDVDRARREGPDIVPALRRARERWGLGAIWIEKVGFQLALVQEARRAGLPIRELEADKDKVARALPATAELEGGRVWFPRAAAWLDDCEAEVLSFPGGRHDDFTDTLSYAVRVARGVGEIACGSIDPEHVMPRAAAREAREERIAEIEQTRRHREAAESGGDGGGEGGAGSAGSPDEVPEDDDAILSRRLGISLGSGGRSRGRLWA